MDSLVPSTYVTPPLVAAVVPLNRPLVQLALRATGFELGLVVCTSGLMIALRHGDRCWQLTAGCL